MKVAGNVEYNGSEYIIMIKYSKHVTYYYLLSKYHKEDQPTVAFGGGNLKHPVRQLIDYTVLPVDPNYIVGCIQRKVVKGDMKYFGGYDILVDIIENLRLMQTYSFKFSDVIVNDPPYVNGQGDIIKEFSARDHKYGISYTRIGGSFARVNFRSNDMQINFSESDHKFPAAKLINAQLIDLNVNKKSRLYYSGARVIDYESIIQGMNHDWFFTYDEDGNEIYHKDYRDIETESDFEKYVIDELVEEIKLARVENRLPVVIGTDTETDGLDVYDIPRSIQSTVVAFIIAFKDDSSRLVYTDMECFGNVSIEYVKRRLEPFLSKDILNDDEITIETSGGPFSFRRSEIFNVGQNCMFDIRACAVHDFDIWYDADDLQMSFNLDPFITKGHNGLKDVSHFLFNHETLELSEVLGKGNEDKFRSITDRRIARLYGCPDGDYTRKVFFALREIYRQSEPFHRKDLFKVYQDQDVLMMNVCAKMDYSGMRIDRDMFVKKGEEVVADMEIITNFAYNFVGRMLEMNQYLHEKVELVKREMEVLMEEGMDPAQAKEVALSVVDKKLPAPDPEKAKPYKFAFSGKDLIDTLYYQLGYPVLVKTEPPKSKSDGSGPKGLGKPAVNKTAMKKLMQRRSVAGDSFLKHDVMGVNGKPLIKAKDFNQYRYPVAYLVSLIGPRKKEYESYFKPFVEDSYGDRLCKNTSFSRMDTRRIANPVQTIKGSLKKYMLPHSDEYAFCDFDMSQVELRIMAGIANDIVTMDKMRDPEADSHTECAADLEGIKPFLVTKEQRSGAKSVNFGYPYGLMDFSMCEQRYGDTSEEHLIETRLLIEKFEKSRHIIVEFLNTVRAKTLKPVGTCEEEPIPIPECLRAYLRIGPDIPVGIVRNLKGFYKLFQLNDMDQKKAARIGRQAGNFPVQSFAAELFRIILIRFYIACEKKGWNQKGWIKWNMLIHDELLFSFKKGDIHPIELYEVLSESCIVTFPGHTNYYIGINIGNNWGECKDDHSEAPVHMVTRLVERWKKGEFAGERVEDPKTYIDEKRKEYVISRIGEVIGQYYPEINGDLLNGKLINDGFENYTVKKYIYEGFKPLWEPGTVFVKDLEKEVVVEEDLFDSCLCRWLIEFKGAPFTFVTQNGREIVVDPEMSNLSKLGVDGKSYPLLFGEMFEGCKISHTVVNKLIDLEEDDSYYKEINWDLDEFSNPYYFDKDSGVMDETLTYEYLFEEEDYGGSFESLRKTQDVKYKYVEVIGDRVFLKLDRARNIPLVQKYIKDNNLAVGKGGVQLFYKTAVATSKGCLVSKVDISELDNYIYKLRG